MPAKLAFSWTDISLLTIMFRDGVRDAGLASVLPELSRQ